jgi:protein TonB
MAMTGAVVRVLGAMLGGVLLVACAARATAPVQPTEETPAAREAPALSGPSLERAKGAGRFAQSAAADGPSAVSPPSENEAPFEAQGGYDLAPIPVHVPNPEYPAEARAKEIHGRVVVEFVIDRSGRVSRARVVRSIPGLDEAAVECVRRWQFKPALLGGKPVETTAQAPVDF